jgi:hypothetical protein
MIWTTDDILNFTKFLTRKNQSASISAGDLFYAWNSEQRAYHQDLLGRWQNRNNGKSGMNTGLVQNETIINQLAPFILQETITITDGEAIKPEDFIFDVALRINGENVTKINHGQIANVNNSVIDAPSVTTNTYYAAVYEDYFQIFPSTATSLVLDYVADVRDIKWGYSFDGEGRQVYNSGTSVNPKWANNNVIVEITKRTLRNFGVSYKDADFSNYGENVINSGNA